jgi:hypothetical protein
MVQRIQFHLRSANVLFSQPPAKQPHFQIQIDQLRLKDGKDGKDGKDHVT